MNKLIPIICFMSFFGFTKGQEIMDTTIVIAEQVIYFDSDEWILGEDDTKLIDNFLFQAKDREIFKLFVKAHTDKVGSNEYNVALSEKRKASILNLLENNGISDYLIVSSHHGESQLAKVGEGESSNKLNRRVTLQVLLEKKLIYLSGNVFDPEDKEGIEADIELHTRDFYSKTSTDPGGNFKILSPLEEKVTLEVLAKGYFIEANNINISDKHIDLKLKIPLPKLELGKRYLFRNMLFHGNRSVMISSSEFAAYHLKRFMSLNDEVCIEIAGHINLPNRPNVEKESGYFELSIARALFIKEELVQIGVNENRMVARGYGNWEMKFPKAQNAKEMQQNRRVEIGIIDCENVKTLADDFIEDRKRYQIPNRQRLYVGRLMKYDLNGMNKRYMTNLILQIGNMRKKGLIPEEFTYIEILNAYPDFPVK